MILRRLSQSLNAQNWTAIVIEFILLVSGVFLGIQVANWNAARQDKKLEGEYIARLSHDFDAIDARLTDNTSRWSQKSAAPLRLLSDLDAFRQYRRWSRTKAQVLADLNETFNYRIPAPRAATYIELLSAGRLGLIGNTKLRDALMAYDIQVGYTQTAFNVLAQRVEPLMGTIVSHLEFDRSLGAPKPEAATLAESVWSDVDLEQLAAEPKLKMTLNMFANASRNQLLVAELQQEKARTVLALLKSGARRTGDDAR